MSLKAFETLKKTRLFILDYIKDLSTEQLNAIPNGFSNNIIWNLAHLVAVPQAVCYKRGGLAMKIDEEIFEQYKPGTIPQPFVNTHQIETYKALLINTIDVLEDDYQDEMFQNYQPWTTRTHVELKTIEESINFLSWHDGLHMGVIMSLKKLV